MALGIRQQAIVAVSTVVIVAGVAGGVQYALNLNDSTPVVQEQQTEQTVDQANKFPLFYKDCFTIELTNCI